MDTVRNTPRQGQRRCAACNAPVGNHVPQDRVGNWLCEKCAAELRALSNSKVTEPPPGLAASTSSASAPSVEPLRSVPCAVAPRPQISTWMAFWDFRWMIMPVFIRALFVVAVLACAVVGMTMIVKGVYSTDPVMPVLNGLGVLILGPLAYRLIAEWLIVFFRIHEALESIDRKLGER